MGLFWGFVTPDFRRSYIAVKGIASRSYGREAMAYVQAPAKGYRAVT